MITSRNGTAPKLERLRIEADKQGIDELILVTRGKGFGIGVVQRIK